MIEYKEIDNWIEDEFKKLDISPTDYRKAVDRYMAVGNMLENKLKDEYDIDSHVYAQGSFMIGTVVRPYGRDKEYDVDLVCECDLSKDEINPKDLKKMIGNILQEDGVYGKMMSADEGRRTWTINYAEDSNLSFHIDIQPSIPKTDSCYELAISTTTKKKHNSNEYVWDNGNPLGFKKWFDKINNESYNNVAKMQANYLFENNSFYASVDDIPKQLIITKLQRLVQILKRHRDIRFEKHKYSDDKPSSIIITVLATMVFDKYGSDLSLLELIEQFANTIYTNLDLIDRTNENVTGLFIDMVDGNFVILNPTVEENLAERWNVNDNHKKQAFYDWITWVLSDFKVISKENAFMKFEKGGFDDFVRNCSLSDTNVFDNIDTKTVDLLNTPKPWKNNV